MTEADNHSHVSYLYGAVDLVFAGVYALVFYWLVPSRSLLWNIVAALLCLVSVVGGVGMIVPRRWGRRAAAASSIVLLGACATLVALLIASAAYLHAIYGGVGQAGAALAVIAAALAIEILGVVPALQLTRVVRATRRVG